MKDIDKLLGQALPRPRRELSSDFTARVVAELKAQPTASQKGTEKMKFRHAPLIAGIAAMILIGIGGGVAYAATSGFTKPFDLKNIFGYQETVQPDGKRVVAIKTTNCSTSDAAADAADQVMWFRLKDGATISTDEMLRWTEGYCESITQPNFNTLLAERGITDEIIGFLASGKVVAKNTDGGLKISQHYDFDGSTEVSDFTLLGNAPVVIGTAESSLASVKVGDTIEFLTTSVEDAEGVSAASSTIVYLRVLTPNEQLFDSKHEEFAKQVERVQPCLQDSGAYCAYGFAGESSDKEVNEAKEYVKHAYGEYWQNSKVPNIDTPGDWESNRKAFKDTYTTDKAAKYLERPVNADPILCAQNGVTNTVYSSGSPVRNGHLITVPVIRSYPMEDGSTHTEVFADATYDTRAGKISALTCTIEMGF